MYLMLRRFGSKSSKCPKGKRNVYETEDGDDGDRAGRLPVLPPLCFLQAAMWTWLLPPLPVAPPFGPCCSGLAAGCLTGRLPMAAAAAAAAFCSWAEE